MQSDFERFAMLTDQYCSLIENPQDDLALWLKAVRITLAELYALGLRLPQSEDGDFAEDFSMPHEEWKSVFCKISARLNVRSMYWGVSNQLALPDAAPTAKLQNLDDDLADVYRDLKCGLTAWNSSGPARYAHAMHYWRFSVSFEHWSTHAINALGALHAICKLDES